MNTLPTGTPVSEVKTMKEFYDTIKEQAVRDFADLLDSAYKRRKQFDIGLVGKQEALYFAVVMQAFLDQGRVMSGSVSPYGPNDYTYFLHLQFGHSDVAKGEVDLWFGGSEAPEPVIAARSGVLWRDEPEVPKVMFEPDLLERAAQIAFETDSVTTGNKLRALAAEVRELRRSFSSMLNR